ncbi:unnamed protein product, partial [Iphiclides podalirius]
MASPEPHSEAATGTPADDVEISRRYRRLLTRSVRRQRRRSGGLAVRNQSLIKADGRICGRCRARLIERKGTVGRAECRRDVSINPIAAGNARSPQTCRAAVLMRMNCQKWREAFLILSNPY